MSEICLSILVWRVENLLLGKECVKNLENNQSKSILQDNFLCLKEINLERNNLCSIENISQIAMPLLK